MDIDDLKLTYKSVGKRIKNKLSEFEETFLRSDEDIFLELCFCILAAGTSALLALNTVEKIKDIVFSADRDEMQRALMSSRYRFHTVRADYLVTTRDYLSEDCGFMIKEKINSFPDRLSRREYFAENKGIKGIAYKEGSHFLRNIGFKGYAILDKHIVNSLYELGVIESDKRPSTKRRYIELEERLTQFAKEIGIDFDELDLLLWYSKTGDMIK